MKKLLLVSSLLLILCIWACNYNSTSKSQNETMSNEDKVVNHGNPDQAKLDSIKAAKTKGKQ